MMVDESVPEDIEERASALLKRFELEIEIVASCFSHLSKLKSWRECANVFSHLDLFLANVASGKGVGG